MNWSTYTFRTAREACSEFGDQCLVDTLHPEPSEFLSWVRVVTGDRLRNFPIVATYLSSIGLGVNSLLSGWQFTGCYQFFK